MASAIASGVVPLEDGLRAIARDANCVRDSDASKRKGGIIRLVAILAPESGESPEWSWAVWMAEAQGLVFAALGDERESVRVAAIEGAAKLIQSFAARSDPDSATVAASVLGPFVEVCAARIGAQPFAEASEEVRLGLIELLTTLFQMLAPIKGTDGTEAAETSISGCLDGIARCLGRAPADPNPATKLASCAALEALCRAAPTVVHRVLGRLAKAQLSSCGHQRAPVRCAAVHALSVLLPLGAESLLDLMNGHILPKLEDMGEDRSPAARSSLCDCCAVLLQCLPLHGSIGSKEERVMARLAVILLSRLADTVPDVAIRAWEALQVAGESERWTSLGSAALDSPHAVPTATEPATSSSSSSSSSSAAVGSTAESARDDDLELELPAPFLDTRPGRAERGLAVVLLDAVLPLVLASLGEWTAPRRTGAAGALRGLVCLSETSISRHLDDVVGALLSAARDDEPDVRALAADTGALVGAYCDAPAVIHCLLPQIRGTAISGAAADAGLRAAALAVLSDTVSGMDEVQATPLLQPMAIALSDSSLAALDPAELPPRLLAAVRAVIDVGGSAAGSDTAVRDGLALALLGLQRQRADSHVAGEAAALASDLAAATGSSMWEVYEGAVAGVVDRALHEAAAWSTASPSRWLLDAACRVCPQTLTPHCTSMLRVMQSALDTSRPAEVRVSAVAALKGLIDAAAAGSPYAEPPPSTSSTSSSSSSSAASAASAAVKAAASRVEAAAATAVETAAARVVSSSKRQRRQPRSKTRISAVLGGYSSESAASIAAQATRDKGGSSSDAADAAADAELDALLAGTGGLDPMFMGRAGGKKTKKQKKKSKKTLLDESASATGKATGRAAGEAARRAVAALKAQEAAVLGISEDELASQQHDVGMALESSSAIDSTSAAAAAAAAMAAMSATGLSSISATSSRSAEAVSSVSMPRAADTSLRPLHAAMRQVAPALLTQVLEPNMQWRSGRVASTTRKVAVAASLAVWEGGLVSSSERAITLNKLLPSCKACMSDDDAGTRALACGLLAASMTDLAGQLDGEFARAVQADLVKRLDDADDGVRLRACALLAAFSRCAPAIQLKGSPCQWSVDALMIHADDSDPSIAAAAGAALEPWVTVDPEYVRRAATQNRSKHRSPELCDRIISLCEETAL